MCCALMLPWRGDHGTVAVGDLNVGVDAKIADGEPLTELMAEAVARLSELPAERQNELARMLIDVAENDRLLSSGEVGLTPEQWAEVDAALAEEGDDATDEEVAAFFARNRA